MPPKRPRVVPSQTNLSVQDVRDYSTPDGAAMANEEMRRLKMGLQQLQEEQAQQAQDQQAAIAAPAPAAPQEEEDAVELTPYSWFIKAENYREAEVEDKDTVLLRGIDGIRISQVGKRITIGQPRVSWIIRADSGTHTVHYEGIVRIRGVNGVTTRAFPGNPLGTLEIDRPLTVYQRSIAIGNAATVGLNFFNHSNYINKQEHNQIHFQVQDEGNGIRRIIGWAKKGDVSSLQGALSTVWLKDATTEIPLSVGYDVVTGQYINQLLVGPWGWQSAQNVTTPYPNSNYSNNAKDTQWDWGSSNRVSALSAYTRFGKVSESGLYLISGTTQGMRYLTSAMYPTMQQYINLRLHYHIVVRRMEGETPVTRIYKTLDIEPWDMWAVGILTDLETVQLFIARMGTLPWSLQGTAQIWLNADDEVGHLITYNQGNNGEARMVFQATYHAFEAIKVADATTLDPATQVDLNPINAPDGPTQYHTMLFTNV